MACKILPMSIVTPRLTVAVVMARAGKLLFVEERDADGVVLNQPAGHVEPGESLHKAAVREAREETGWDVGLRAIVGVYRWQVPGGDAFLRVAFAAEPLAHDAARALDPDIVSTHWLAPSDLARHRHRSPLVQATVDDWLAGVRLPLSAVQEFA